MRIIIAIAREVFCKCFKEVWCVFSRIYFGESRCHLYDNEKYGI